MEYIDLHMHSRFSDGTDTPEEIVVKAKEAGLKMIALTDHNTLAGIDEFRAARDKYCGGENDMICIDGIELSTVWHDPDNLDGEPPEIHVLGWFPPDSDFNSPDFELLRKVIDDYRTSKIRANEAMVSKMQEAGIGNGRLSVEGFNSFVQRFSGSGNYNRVHIAHYLIALGVVGSIDEAMDIYIGKKCPYYVRRQALTVRDAIEAIHAVNNKESTGINDKGSDDDKKKGGIAVIAHPGEYKLGEARLQAFFAYCMEHNVDGFELLHPHNTPAVAGQILSLADRVRREEGRVLLLTAGSDYHGRNKKNKPGFPWKPPYAWE